MPITGPTQIISLRISKTHQNSVMQVCEKGGPVPFSNNIKSMNMMINHSISGGFPTFLPTTQDAVALQGGCWRGQWTVARQHAWGGHITMKGAASCVARGCRQQDSGEAGLPGRRQPTKYEGYPWEINDIMLMFNRNPNLIFATLLQFDGIQCDFMGYI